jgi:predicted secreted protein
MNKIETFVTFALSWWLVFYLTLPFGIEKEDNPIPGQSLGAPKNARIGLKMLVTTGITLTITLLFYLYMNY